MYLAMATGLSHPGKSREGPGTGQDRTGPRDLEGPVVLAGQDLETLKVPGLFLKVPGPPGPFFPLELACVVYQFEHIDRFAASFYTTLVSN